MQYILAHTLKGKFGWSCLKHNIIHIIKIKEIKYNKRLFCLFDKSYPYSLCIRYYESTENTDINSNCACGATGFTYIMHTKLEHTITRRYSSEIELIDEVTQIMNKINILQLYKKKLDTIDTIR